MHAPARPGPGHDPLGQARALVEDTPTALLDVTATPEQERCAASVFVTTLEQLVDALSERADTAAAVPALTQAADHLRSGELADTRDELLTARATLLPAPSTGGGIAEVCDVCERVSPRWSVPVTGATIDVLPGLAAPAALLVCPSGRDQVADTSSDGELAERLGLDQLPRSLRGLHGRIAGRPVPWPGDQHR